jgi:arabinose-5-phosphate isomerase
MDLFVESGRRTLLQQGAALSALSSQLDDSFAQAARLLARCAGRVVVSGVGKSGLVGRKIAATLASTDTPAFFLHPTDAMHGDLGAVGREDVLLLLSKSGETDELLRLVPAARRRCAAAVAIVGEAQCSLSRLVEVTVVVSVPDEACPLRLAPTTSTTAMMAIGDALAIALMEARGLDAEGFAALHPAGSLGRLLGPVSDLMVTEPLPIVSPDAPMAAVISAMNRGRLGLAVVCQEGRQIAGLITDGDLRRALALGPAVLDQAAGAVMTRRPRWVPPGLRAAEARDRMTRDRITALLVSDDGEELAGVIHLHHIDQVR